VAVLIDALTFTAFGSQLLLQRNSIFLSHHSNHQLQPAQQYFSLTPLQPPAPACRTQCLFQSIEFIQPERPEKSVEMLLAAHAAFDNEE